MKRRRGVACFNRRVRIVTKQTVFEGHIWVNGTKKLKNGINQRSGIMPVAKTWGQEACGGDVKKQGRLRRSTFSWRPRKMKIEHELAFAATLHWAKPCWDGTWADDMAEAWTRQVFEASRSHV